jgi:outer membrane protein OmpA-like peptidoglycan-associated protein
MRNHNRFAIVFCFLGFFLISLSQANSTPQISEADYTDYLPKYRTVSSNFLISKIDYTETDIVVFFRYVASQNNDVINFYGANNEQAWKLTSSARSEASSAYSITRSSNVKNIRLNDEAKIVELHVDANKRISAQRGDVITCEVHFQTMPRSIRTVHLIGGDLNKDGVQRFNCNDILLKTKDSKMLGNDGQMAAVIKRFYSEQEKVNYPDIKNATTLAEQASFEKKDKVEKVIQNPLAKSLEPIDYMPKSLSSIEDMACNERIILSNIYFHDNKSEFVGRVKAMKTVNMIVDYLTFHPNAKIVLHGHTDIFGNAFKNLELSQKRVFTVKRSIVGKGIDANRIITIHHGGAQPLIQYKNGSEMNRRVEAEVLCSGKIKNTTLQTVDSKTVDQ